MDRRNRLRPLVALAAASLLVGACGTTAPSSSPAPGPTPSSSPPTSTQAPETAGPSGPPPADAYAEIRAQVEAIRGLTPSSAVDPVVIDAAQLAKNLESEFDATHDAAALQDAEDLLIALGLLPPGSSLRQLTLDFQAGQVAGYYSPEQDELFVVSRTAAIGPADESTYAHEFTHQLQDQRFDLDALGIDAVDQSDRSLARLALVEGDATSVQTTWMTRNLTPAELGEVLAAGLDPDALEAFNNAPAYLRETALFPYQDGLAFVMPRIASGGYAAVDAVFADPPDSTEQVLHPAKYATREAPLPVAIPADLAASLGSGWSEAGQDTLGELILRIWLKAGGVSAAQAATAAAGWGGDRIALLRGPNGRLGVYLRIAWDTPGDADEFAAAARTVVAGLPLGGAVVHPPEAPIVEIAIGAVTDLLES